MLLALGLEEIKGFCKVCITDRIRVDVIKFAMKLVPQVHVELLDFASEGAFELNARLVLLMAKLGDKIFVLCNNVKKLSVLLPEQSFFHCKLFNL